MTFQVNQGTGKISSFWSRDSLLAFVASFWLGISHCIRHCSLAEIDKVLCSSLTHIVECALSIMVVVE